MKKTTKDKVITTELIEQAMSYQQYRLLIDNQLKEGKTTGTKQSEDLTEYTKLNVQRMNRLEKQIELNDSLKQKLKKVSEPWIWLVLTEGWCGDAAQNVPVIHKMAEAAPNITLKLILRTEHTEVMDQYLTNGGRSIPKLVCLQAESLKEIGTWGPRPGSFQKKAMQWKDDDSISHEDWAEKLHAWYASDKSQTMQHDFEKLLAKWD